MQIVKEPALLMPFVNKPIGPDRWQLRLNKKEMAAIERADNIREEVRDRLREAMGWEAFEASDFYVMHLGDILDLDGVFTFDWDYSGDRI